MLRSMYSGISGLKNFQTKLDVIGNNISNVNTYGFKKGRTVFKDLYSQTVAGASAPVGNTRGGVNPKQVGLGSQLAAIDTLHTAGSTQFTGNTLDLAIEGDGFFIVQDGANTTDVQYTRAGNFYMDKSGALVDGDGRFVMGFQGINGDTAVGTTRGKLTIPSDATNMSIGQDGTVNYVQGGVLKIAGQVQIATFNNPGGLEKVGGNMYKESANSGGALAGAPLTDGRGTVKSGSLEMSNVDLSEEFTEMIVAQRGFQANTRIITTSDEILQELVNLKR
ncbi:flagellar basal body rod protein FlgG [Sporosarcina gallistercoris]|uniref:Flagellar hook protein FlgE n=1 Tax=Sporosarcina gallistercoris TaxID=2762245 RepID=A0ABR8PG29_9BACL|nr:flagellar basal body rod protein FlgG [Sporosarcina gallistercoris]MBD7907125.1 flagellar basal body rod protein FlgG [Sporosarcina gallistercoris]